MKTRLIVLSALALCSASAFADAYTYTCTTTSNGRDFSFDSRDPSYAKDRVMSDCRANSYTVNEECNVNVACNDGSYYAEFATCDTMSNGRTFQVSSRSTEFAGRRALEQCKANSYTVNAECDANLYCDAGMVPPAPPAPPVPTGGYCPDPNTYYDYETGRCVSMSTPAPVGRCPDPSTVWDARIGRCVSAATPPAPRPIPGRPAPRPIARMVTCSIHGMSASDYDQGIAMRAVLAQCAAASRGYVCSGSQVVCR